MLIMSQVLFLYFATYNFKLAHDSGFLDFQYSILMSHYHEMQNNATNILLQMNIWISHKRNVLLSVHHKYWFSIAAILPFKIEISTSFII